MTAEVLGRLRRAAHSHALDCQDRAWHILKRYSVEQAPREVVSLISRIVKESRWVVTGSYDSAALWHSRCLRVPMSARRQYTLILEMGDSDPSGLVKALTPTLEGGGFELP